MTSEQESIYDSEKIKSTVRMTPDEREAVDRVFGGVQRAFDHVLNEAIHERGWIPNIPKRLVPAYKAIRDIAMKDKYHNLNSKQMREAVICGCDCTRQTAIRYLHDLKMRGLIFTFQPVGMEYVHFVACSEEDLKDIEKAHTSPDFNMGR